MNGVELKLDKAQNTLVTDDGRVFHVARWNDKLGTMIPELGVRPNTQYWKVVEIHPENPELGRVVGGTPWGHKTYEEAIAATPMTDWGARWRLMQ